MVEDVHSVSGQVPWETDLEEEVCLQEIEWNALGINTSEGVRIAEFHTGR